MQMSQAQSRWYLSHKSISMKSLPRLMLPGLLWYNPRCWYVSSFTTTREPCPRSTATNWRRQSTTVVLSTRPIERTWNRDSEGQQFRRDGPIRRISDPGDSGSSSYRKTKAENWELSRSFWKGWGTSITLANWGCCPKWLMYVPLI